MQFFGACIVMMSSQHVDLECTEDSLVKESGLTEIPRLSYTHAKATFPVCPREYTVAFKHKQAFPIHARLKVAVKK